MTPISVVFLVFLLLSTQQYGHSYFIPVPLKGVIFDMDGTLIKSVIDFPDMRRRIYHVATEDLGVSVQSGDVLALADTLSEKAQADVKVILEDIEAKALRDMELNTGMVELCAFLDQQKIPRALLTRNVESSVEYMHTNKMSSIPHFQPAIARDTVNSGNILRPKPFPDAIFHICQQWNCDPSQVMMVGDSLQDDIVAANRAGCISVHLSSGKDNDSGNANESFQEERAPDIVIQSLSELRAILLTVCSSLPVV